MRVFRICRQRYSVSAMSGEGARLYSGRWNEAGVAMVYCSSSRALAAMEFFVHLEPVLAPDDLVMLEIEVPEAVAQDELALGSLPQGWREQDSETAELGSRWARAGKTAVLRVPSAVIDGEWNVLLNPAHADFTRVQVVTESPFHYDERMFR